MHKRFGIILGIALVVASIFNLLISPNASSVSTETVGGRTYSSADGQHIQSVRCTRWDVVAPSGETATNSSATVEWVFADGHIMRRTFTTATGGVLNCGANITARLGEMTSGGNAANWHNCPPGQHCIISPDNAPTHVLFNDSWVQFPDLTPPDDATISVSPSSVTLSCPNSGTWWGPSNSQTVTVSLTGTTESWEVITKSDGFLMAGRSGDQLSISMLGIGCQGGGTHSVTVGIPGTTVTATISVNLSVYDPHDPNDPNNPNIPGGPGPGGDSPRTCDAGQGGWIICPIMNFLDNTLGSIYGWIESNFLQIDIAFYDTDSPTHDFWVNFRNIANVLFVIFFLVVIFSQVTSIGISNYGIKKMLPEIILAAILINLSFFIAQAMVDVSNIVGFTIRGFLETIVGGTGIGEVNPAGAGFIALILGVIGVATAAVVLTLILTGGLWAVVLAVLMGLLVATVGILMMFVILIVRQIGVIILVVLSPLAFAARILPNTRSLFDKWWKSFVALLVVYPMCSLVIGLGAVAATIIGSQIPAIADDATYLTIEQGIWLVAAMLATIVPYFAVITITKGALGGLGKLGAFIAGGVVGAGMATRRMGGNALDKSILGEKAKQRTALGMSMDSRRNARTQIAKDKAEQIAINKAAGGKGVYGKLRDSQIATTQAKEYGAMASAGEYDGETTTKQGQRYASYSRNSSIELGNYKEGNINYDRDFAAAEKTALDRGLSTADARDEATKKLAGDRRLSSKNAGTYQLGDASYDADMAKAATLSGAARTNRENEIKEAATMSSVAAGTYVPGSANYNRDLAAAGGTENNLMKGRRELSAKNAAQPDAHSRATRRAQAETAINRRDAELGKEADLALGSMNTATAQAYGANAIANGDYVKATRAISKLQAEGKVAEARQLTQDYTTAGVGGARGRAALGQVGKNKDTKADAFGDYSYYKYIAENPESIATIGDYYAGTNEFATNGKSFADDVNSGKYMQSYSSMDKDTADHIARIDTTGDIRVRMLSQMDAQRVGQFGENNLNTLVDGTVTGHTGFAAVRTNIRDNYSDAGTNAASFGYTASMKGKFGI